MPAEDDEMEPPRIAAQALGGDAAGAPQEALDLAVATVDRDVHGAAHLLTGGAITGASARFTLSASSFGRGEV